MVNPETTPGMESGRIILRSFEKAGLYLCHDGVYREYHVRYVIVNHTEDDRARSAYHFQRLNSDEGEKIVYNAVFLENVHP